MAALRPSSALIPRSGKVGNAGMESDPHPESRGAASGQESAFDDRGRSGRSADESGHSLLRLPRLLSGAW